MFYNRFDTLIVLDCFESNGVYGKTLYCLSSTLYSPLHDNVTFCVFLSQFVNSFPLPTSRCLLSYSTWGNVLNILPMLLSHRETCKPTLFITGTVFFSLLHMLFSNTWYKYNRSAHSTFIWHSVLYLEYIHVNCNAGWQPSIIAPRWYQSGCRVQNLQCWASLSLSPH